MKLYTPSILFAIFALFFSGKPAPTSMYCGPRLNIDVRQLSSSHPILNIIKVTVRNFTTGTTDNYDNPTFPMTHVGTGGDYRITVHFNQACNSGIIEYWPDCEFSNAIGQLANSLELSAFSCDEYSIEVHSHKPGELCECW